LGQKDAELEFKERELRMRSDEVSTFRAELSEFRSHLAERDERIRQLDEHVRRRDDRLKEKDEILQQVITLKGISGFIYSAFIVVHVHSRRSGMDQTVLPANYTMPAFISSPFTRRRYH